MPNYNAHFTFYVKCVIIILVSCHTAKFFGIKKENLMRKIIDFISNLFASILTVMFTLGSALIFLGISVVLAFVFFFVSTFLVSLLNVPFLSSLIEMKILGGVPLGSIIWFVLCLALAGYGVYLTASDGSDKFFS